MVFVRLLALPLLLLASQELPVALKKRKKLSARERERRGNQSLDAVAKAALSTVNAVERQSLLEMLDREEEALEAHLRD